jgi:hypothetical protein
MNPEIKYLILGQDVVIDVTTKEVSIIRIFDNIFVPKESKWPYFYTFYCAGRVDLHRSDMVRSEILVKLLDPSNREMRAIPLQGTFNGGFGINFSPIFLVIPFEREGKYSIQVSIKINDGNFTDVGAPVSFNVRQLN